MAINKRRIGLLGGSFNPAHGGHRHISLIALKRLGLDELWWLVSPQDPLKSEAGMAPLRERMARAARTARHPRIRVTDILEMLAGGMTYEQILADFPYLEIDDIRAALAYAAREISHPVVTAAE